MKFLNIGDIHGIENWSIPTFGSMDRFYDYLDGNCTIRYPHESYDKIIFVGDYVDSFTLSNVEILHNLKNIIEFKKRFPNKVILLTGNHDMQYMKSEVYCQCSGFRAEAYNDLHILFKENKDLFQMAYQYEDWLWTHAGVTKMFLNNCIETMKHPSYRLYDVTKDMNIVELLQVMFDTNNPDIYCVGASSGGNSLMPSPVWARPEDLDNDPIHLNQIVGHTNRDTVRINEINDIKHVYIDCLQNKQWYKLTI